MTFFEHLKPYIEPFKPHCINMEVQIKVQTKSANLDYLYKNILYDSI